MRILFLNHNIRYRGTWFRCFHLGRELVRRGHQVAIITLARLPRRSGLWTESDGVRVFESPRWFPPRRHDGGWAPLDILSRFEPVLRSDWDLIHAFDHRPSVSLPWFVARMLRRSHFAADWCDWWTRGGIVTARRRLKILDRAEARLEEGSKRAAELVTVIGRTLHQRALDIGIPEDRLLLLPSGADIEGIRDEYRIQCREQLGIAPDLDYVEFIGHALWDLRMLFQAFSLVRKRHPRARLLLVGTDKDRTVDALRDEFSLGATLIALGELPPERLSRALGAADLHVLPMQDTLANRGRWPNKLGDYLASGRPVVVSDVGETGEFVRRHAVGDAVHPGPQGLADGILGLLKDRERAREVGRRARRAAETELSWKKSGEILEQAYRRLE